MLVTALALLALAAPSTASALSISDKDTLEASVVARINVVRKGYHLRPLTVADRLANAADRHAESMASASYCVPRALHPRPREPVDAVPHLDPLVLARPRLLVLERRREPRLGGSRDHRLARPSGRWMNSSGHRATQGSNIGVAAVHVRRPARLYSSWDDVTIVAAEFGARR